MANCQRKDSETPGVTIGRTVDIRGTAKGL